MSNVILRLPRVLERTGLCRSALYQNITNGTFPPPVSIGARSVGWVEAEIDLWISRKIRESRDKAAEHANGEAR